MAQFEKVALIDEVSSGGRKSIIVDHTPVLLLRVGDQFYAIEDVCTHDGQPLTDGPLEENLITCPRHGAKFDVTNGKAMCMPATEAVTTYAVEMRGDEVWVGPQD